MVFEALCPNFDFSDDTIQRIIGIFDTNALEIRLACSEVLALYETACLLEHSCVPNLRIIFDDKYHVSLSKAHYFFYVLGSCGLKLCYWRVL